MLTPCLYRPSKILCHFISPLTASSCKFFLNFSNCVKSFFSVCKFLDCFFVTAFGTNLAWWEILFELRFHLSSVSHINRRGNKQLKSVHEIYKLLLLWIWYQNFVKTSKQFLYWTSCNVKELILSLVDLLSMKNVQTIEWTLSLPWYWVLQSLSGCLQTIVFLVKFKEEFQPAIAYNFALPSVCLIYLSLFPMYVLFWTCDHSLFHPKQFWNQINWHKVASCLSTETYFIRN